MRGGLQTSNDRQNQTSSNVMTYGERSAHVFMDECSTGVKMSGFAPRLVRGCCCRIRTQWLHLPPLPLNDCRKKERKKESV